MSDMMTFPDTVEEFMEQYKIVDDEKVYTNGADLVPIFRMKQWFERASTADTISRQEALDIFDDYNVAVENGQIEAYSRDRKRLCDLPSAQPRRIGKWIRNGWAITCSECGYDMPYTVRNFCPNCGADMRGEQDEIHRSY